MKSNGFTFLEVLIIIGIMGFVAAMIWPMRENLDDSQRERVTIERMDAIVEAILGHEQIKDHFDMSRTIGGYVGDIEKWPKLYEPGGDGGLGGERGEFVDDRFRWLRPLREVPDMSKESLGQPRGLWARDELDDDDSINWTGPYLTPPVTRNPALGKFYAQNQTEYDALDDTDRAYFHLLQGGGQLTDGWNRAFRFFISKDPDEPDEQNDNDGLFWIVSLGANGMAVFPDDMALYYSDDEAEPYYKREVNRDNVIRKLHKSDWEAVLAARALRSTSTHQLIFITQDHMDRMVRALIGESPSGPNTGYTGDLLGWPDLFNWVCRDDGDNMVDCEDDIAISGTGKWEYEWEDQPFSDKIAFKYGQPRGLWERGELDASKLGVGWRHAYLDALDGTFESVELKDAWDRPYRFFRVLEQIDGNDVEQFMILSGGESGAFHFPPADESGEPYVDPDYLEAGGPADLPKRVRFFMDHYNADHSLNQDNIVRIVRRNEWLPGFLDVTLAIAGGDCNEVKCRLYGVLPDQSDLVSHVVIDDLCEFEAKYDDNGGVKQIVTGGRYLVCWEGDGDEPSPGDDAWWKIFSTYGHPAKNVNINLSAFNFQPFPDPEADK